MEKHEESTAIYQITTSVGSQTLGEKLIKLVDLGELGAKELVLEKTAFGSITMSLDT